MRLIRKIAQRLERGTTRLGFPWRGAEYLQATLSRKTINALAGVESREVERLRTQIGTINTRWTVIIPTFQRPDLLRRAIRSALSQDQQSITLMVVHDGPAAPCYFRSLPAQVVPFETSQRIGVPGVLRNILLRTTSSPYVAFLDDDNAWAGNHLAIADQYLSRGLDVCWTSIEIATPFGDSYILRAPPHPRMLVRSNRIDMSSIVINRNRNPDILLSRLPRYRGDLRGEDWELISRMLARGALSSWIPEVTVMYLSHNNNHFNAH